MDSRILVSRNDLKPLLLLLPPQWVTGQSGLKPNRSPGQLGSAQLGRVNAVWFFFLLTIFKLNAGSQSAKNQ